MQDNVSEVLGATDIVEIIGGHVELKPAGGARHKGLCPFHSEKTPSFTVSADRQNYYCFGCERHGDAITFLREYHGLTFPEALKQLADRAGIRLASFGGNEAQERKREQLLSLTKFAARFYRDTLNDSMRGAAGREYLRTRQLKPETIERFGVGYVPDEWSALISAARNGGYQDDLLEESGLAKAGTSGRPYDLFRNRVMFPIRDASGHVVAFGGRDLGDSPAKYINSPENQIYKKARVLYGLHDAREAMRESRQAILVEGYFDVLRCFDAGIQNAVAPCGTALTPEQARLLHRYAREVIVIFDGDAAGIRAALRGAGILVAAGLTVRALVLPGGLDPDDFIRDKGADAFRALAAEAQDLVRFYVGANRERAASIEGRTELAKELFAIFRDVEDEILRSEYIKHLAHELGLNAEQCRAEFYKFVNGAPQRTPAIASTDDRPRAPLAYDDMEFIAILLNEGPLLQRVRDELDLAHVEPGPLRDVLEALLGGVDASVARRLERAEARSLYTAAANAEITWGSGGEERVLARLKAFRKHALRREAQRLQEEIERATRLHDDAQVIELMRKKTTVDRQIHEVGAA